MNVVVTGASRGIGLELVSLALRSGGQVLAVARRPQDSEGLKELSQEFGNALSTVEADLAGPEAVAKITTGLKSWDHVDLLFNNAGVLRQGITQEDFTQSFQVNSVAPFLTIKGLTPWLKKSAAPRAINITSLMGSIQDNQSGGYYAYRASKAALNMLNKSLSIDLPWLTTIVVHPGWVKTDMGGAGAPLEVAESAAGLWQVGQKLKPGQSGGFFDFRGKSLPW